LETVLRVSGGSFQVGFEVGKTWRGAIQGGGGKVGSFTSRNLLQGRGDHRGARGSGGVNGNDLELKRKSNTNLCCSWGNPPGVLSRQLSIDRVETKWGRIRRRTQPRERWSNANEKVSGFFSPSHHGAWKRFGRGKEGGGKVENGRSLGRRVFFDPEI